MPSVVLSLPAAWVFAGGLLRLRLRLPRLLQQRAFKLPASAGAGRRGSPLGLAGGVMRSQPGSREVLK